MATNDLKGLVELWSRSRRRLKYLQAMRAALGLGGDPQLALDLDRKIAEADAEVRRLQKAATEGG